MINNIKRCHLLKPNYGCNYPYPCELFCFHANADERESSTRATIKYSMKSTFLWPPTTSYKFVKFILSLISSSCFELKVFPVTMHKHTFLIK